MSPVRKRPSMKASADPAGLFQYPLVTFGPLMRISPTSPSGSTFVGSSSDTTSISMPGKATPTEPGLSGPAPAGAKLHTDLALEDLCNFHRQRCATRAGGSQRRKIALVEIGKCGDRDPHRRHAGEGGGALDLDVA